MTCRTDFICWNASLWPRASVRQNNLVSNYSLSTHLRHPTFSGYSSASRRGRTRDWDCPADGPWWACGSPAGPVGDGGWAHTVPDHPSRTCGSFVRSRSCTVRSMVRRREHAMKMDDERRGRENRRLVDVNKWNGSCPNKKLFEVTFLWHHSSRPSLAVISSTEMSWMANLRMIVHICSDRSKWLEAGGWNERASPTKSNLLSPGSF